MKSFIAINLIVGCLVVASLAQKEDKSELNFGAVPSLELGSPSSVAEEDDEDAAGVRNKRQFGFGGGYGRRGFGGYGRRGFGGGYGRRGFGGGYGGGYGYGGYGR